MTDLNPFSRLADFVICDDSQDKKEIIDHGINISTSVMNQLDKFNINKDQTKCLFTCSCDSNYDKFKEVIFGLENRLTGYCEKCDCNWGPSRTGERTQCFMNDCNEEGYKFCTGCYIVRYCSVECQRRSWKGPNGHKTRCGENKKKILKVLELCRNEKNSQDNIISLTKNVISNKGIKGFICKYQI
jgi:hypothetical protein